ncbi:eukaryotic translation initiation factor 2-alpha kinase 3 [Monomorium pharaonis]|uniref:eukaryotic translation initiation factor 2-alpha kinase 3 n=1 Tax=Monomorium pharaonis TaxID=307658 RepID=UPI00174709B4|nr:eukaryotic translation initiation factor 2-alpha kinase 3 [Monomorium pharaonis]
MSSGKISDDAETTTTMPSNPGPSTNKRYVKIQKSDTTNDYSKNVSNKRFQNDFKEISFLGEGGFGIVFKAKHKIDDYNYAVKRIDISNNQYSKKRVREEVKALANLNHPNIVRYCSTWLECLSSRGQEEKDQEWINKLRGSTEFLSEGTQTETKTNFVYNNVLQTDYSSLRRRCENLKLDNADINIKKNRKRKTSFTSGVSKKFQKSVKMFLYIQMELCQKRTLEEWLQNESKRDFHWILNIFDQMVNAVEYIHLNNLIHRDLKPSNIFFDCNDQNKIKIGDFGLVTAITEGYDEAHTHTSAAKNKNASFKNNVYTAGVGTHLYMAPEQRNKQNYNCKVDIYSLGVILFELLTPFSTKKEREKMLTDLQLLKFPKNFAEVDWFIFDNIIPEIKSDLQEFLKSMLNKNPDRRLSALDIKAQSFLRYLKYIMLQLFHIISSLIAKHIGGILANIG